MDLTLPDGRMVTIEGVSKGVVKINSREFKLNLDRPLKETHKQLAKLLDETLNPKNALYDFLFPEAQAFWPIVALFAIFFVLPAVIYVAYLGEVQSNLDETLKSCEERDKKIPFEDSKVAEHLQYLKAHSVYTVEDQRRISDCAVWARNYSKRDGAPTVDTLLKMCQVGDKIMKCVDAYKAESAQLRSPKGGETPATR